MRVDERGYQHWCVCGMSPCPKTETPREARLAVAEEERDQLKAEVERLRGCLWKIVDGEPKYGGYLQAVARLALAGREWPRVDDAAEAQ